MPTELKSLKVNRVDLVPEGANSAAFVTLYKWKEMNGMELSEIIEKLKPEHAELIQAQLDALSKERDEAITARDEALAKAKAAESANPKNPGSAENTDEDEDETDDGGTNAAKACRKETEGTLSFDDDEQVAKGLASLDPVLRNYVTRLTEQKAAAEAVAKQAIAKEKHNAALLKADELKALPVEKSALVSFIEASNDEAVDMLTAIAKGIEATVLSEVGKSASDTSFTSSASAWSKIEKMAQSIASERSITKEAAVAVVLDEQPELYREYLKGGAN